MATKGGISMAATKTLVGAAVLKFSDDDIAKVKQLRAAGLSFKMIAKRTNMSPMSAWRMLHNQQRAADRPATITTTRVVQ